MMTITQIRSKAKDSADVIWRNRLMVVIVFVLLVAVAVFALSFLQKNYVAGANLLVVNGTTRDDPTLSSPDLPSIATSTVVLSRTEKELGLTIPLVELKRHLVVKPPAFRSSILRVEYTDTNANRAISISNGVADQLTAYYREISTARYDQDLASLESEMTKQRDLTRRIDQQVRAHGASAAVPGANEADLAANRMSDLETTRALAIATLQGDVANATAVRAGASAKAKVARYEILREDQAYKDLKLSASASQVALANARATYTSAYPALPALAQKSKILDSAASQEANRAINSSDAYSPAVATLASDQQKANATVAADRAKLAAYDQLLARERVRSISLPSLGALRLERDAASAAYLAISARRATALANRADALSLGSVVVLDRAIATDAQTGLGKNRLLALFSLIALALAVGSAFLLDALDPRFRRATQIEDVYGHPVVGTLGDL
jgi:capsular polysaccharide biosynthesis protein